MIGLVISLSMAAQSIAADLRWMAGSWSQETPGVIVREIWLEPINGAMAGAGQTNLAGREPFIEHMSITDEPAGLTFTATIRGQEPTAFLLKSWQNETYVFENLAHDRPQRVIYRRCDADLCARVESMVDGELVSQDWRYKRVTP